MSHILELLFQFCYPECDLYLDNLPFNTLAKLAEAMEKYKVFSAIDICRIRMKCVSSLHVYDWASSLLMSVRDLLPQNAFEILIYGAKYGHLDVCQKAAPTVVLQNPLSDVMPRLPTALLIPWVMNVVHCQNCI